VARKRELAPARAVQISPLEIDEEEVTTISISIGIATSKSGDNYERLARRADRALYDAKAEGRNTVRWAA
jgi:diguanylate cyclase (GGDEF)-like protein